MRWQERALFGYIYLLFNLRVVDGVYAVRTSATGNWTGQGLGQTSFSRSAFPVYQIQQRVIQNRMDTAKGCVAGDFLKRGMRTL